MKGGEEERREGGEKWRKRRREILGNANIIYERREENRAL